MEFRKFLLFLSLAIFLSASCGNDDDISMEDCQNCTDEIYNPTPYELAVPANFPLYNIPTDNPMTEEGLALGRMLFYDPILSGDSTLACAGCHKQEFAFTDENQFSTGIDGLQGDRNAMQAFNLLWTSKLFWDGRSEGIEAQALEPVINPIEMHELWPNAVNKLQGHSDYPALFYKAFGTCNITKELAAKAIAQFERTLLSTNSQYDKIITPGSGQFYTKEQQRGADIYNSEIGDCFHCHGSILFTDNLFHNNALDANHDDDIGLEAITNNPFDRGKFKTPSLRNIALTAPYMHDGRFQTLEEVVNFYSEGLQNSESVDPLMKKINEGGIHLTAQQKSDLISFLHLLTDVEFTENEAFSNPF